MKIAVRADASREMGHGHVMRCLALAMALRDRGAEVSFHCRSLEGHAFPVIGQAGFACFPIAPEEDVPACDWLIVDHYDLDATWEGAQRRRAGRIMVIDDLANRHHDCDLLLDQNLNPAGPERYAPLLPLDCPQILGPHFALLRPEFAFERGRVAPRSGHVARLLVCFGGGDLDDVTGWVVDMLAEAFPQISVDVVVGAANPNVPSLRRRCEHHPHATLSVAVEDMARRMRRADLFIGGGGSITWERAALGLPGITLSIAANQLPVAAAIAARGAGVDMGRAEDTLPLALQARLGDLLSRPQFVQDMSLRLSALCDGGGARRVATKMLN
ncbi:UDP-2,4-diacetamido-2,4,6-trideoxy-beta-L-altropyranose hydrolase [Viridibacterium curvum]|uniref:UDP-2,4-diacetamido-2,4, 6-trideoxy-beta-L-altropyranose hydrolase n=1 Tax=Viridibacterium curvum TaxID=1101404 RepID=A0ABP9QBP2_9RHOO